jgi:hypothetical protein
MSQRMLADVRAVGQVDIGTGDRAHHIRVEFVVDGRRYELHLKELEDE